MCGLAGFSLNIDEDVNALRLAASLLLGIEDRGGQATGAAWFAPETLLVSKAPMEAGEFVNHLAMAAYTQTAILHTRWASKGDPAENGNNHPIDVVGLVGTHNGVISNDTEILRALADHRLYFQQFDVDSEAAFAVIAHSGLPPAQVLPVIHGSAALAWLEAEDTTQTLHLARISASPLIVGTTEAGSIVYASTRAALRDAELVTDLKFVSMEAMAEGTYMTVKQNPDSGATDVETVTFAVERRGDLTETEKKALNLA